MKNTDLNTIKVFILALVLVLGMNFVSAIETEDLIIDEAPPMWGPEGEEGGVFLGETCLINTEFAEPGVAAPAYGDDVAGADDNDFIKLGKMVLGCIPGERIYDFSTYKLDVNGLTTSRGMSVNQTFKSLDSVFVGVAPYQAASKLLVGGRIGIGTEEPEDALHIATSTGGLILRELAHGDQNPRELCADLYGVLILCPLPPGIVGYIYGPTVTNEFNFIDEIENNETDNNCEADVSFSGGATGGTGTPPSYTHSWRIRNNGSTPLIQINGTSVEAGEWFSLGSGSSKSFSVKVKNPAVYGRDDWTIELTSTDGVGASGTSELDFSVWSEAEGCY